MPAAKWGKRARKRLRMCRLAASAASWGAEKMCRQMAAAKSAVAAHIAEVKKGSNAHVGGKFGDAVAPVTKREMKL
jgi:hypothetical protein